MVEKTNKDELEKVQDEKINNEERKELLDDKIYAYVPKKLNLNYAWERVFVLNWLAYGMSCRKKDNKLMITYNADPYGVQSEHFIEIDPMYIPKNIYKLFQQKLSTDINRMDSMMTNLVKNKKVVWTLFNFAGQRKEDAATGMDEAEAYSEEDAMNDKKLESVKLANQQKLMRWGNTKKKKAKRKATKKSKKK